MNTEDKNKKYREDLSEMINRIGSTVGSNPEVLKNSIASMYGVGSPSFVENIACGIYGTGLKDTAVRVNEEMERQSQIMYGSGSLSDMIKAGTIYSQIPYAPSTLPYESFMAVNPLETKDDQTLTNIHEPMAEQQKQINELKLAILELQINDEQKDIKIKQLENKRRKLKTTKRKSKSNKIVQLEAKISKMEKIISTYEHDWRFTKNAHIEEANDITKE